MLVCVLLDVIVLAVFWGSEMQATVARGHGMHKGALTTNSNNARRDVRLALLLRPDKKNKYRFYWNIYHHSVGYSVIILSAINIFKGFDILKPATGYKTAYIVVLATLGGIALFLEAITWPIAIRKRKRDADKASNGTAGWQQGA
jgi:hypothetical protein